MKVRSLILCGLVLAAAPAAWAQDGYDGTGSLSPEPKSEVSESDKKRDDKIKKQAADSEARLRHQAQTNPDAMTDLGRIVEQRPGEDDPDLAQAYDYYERAADRGERYARERMCVAYLLGQGRPVNVVKGMEYCAKLPEDNATRLFSDGFDYANGLRGPKDEDGAAVFYRTAAERGSGEAMDALGTIALKLGKPDMARRWFRQATAHGALNGIVHYAAMVAEGQAGPANAAEARWLYINAARNGSPEARAWLAAHPETHYLPRTKPGVDDFTETFTDSSGKTRTQALTVNVDSLSALYPRTAEINEIEASVTIHCYVDADHHVDVCMVLAEQPPGYGFGLRIATLFNGNLTVSPTDTFGAATANSVAAFTFRWLMR